MQESAENQKALYQAALDLYSLLRDEECWCVRICFTWEDVETH